MVKLEIFSVTEAKFGKIPKSEGFSKQKLKKSEKFFIIRKICRLLETDSQCRSFAKCQNISAPTILSFGEITVLCLLVNKEH